MNNDRNSNNCVNRNNKRIQHYQERSSLILLYTYDASAEVKWSKRVIGLLGSIQQKDLINKYIIRKNESQ